MTDHFVQVSDFQPGQRQTRKPRELVNHRLQPGNLARDRLGTLVYHGGYLEFFACSFAQSAVSVCTILFTVSGSAPVTLSDPLGRKLYWR